MDELLRIQHSLRAHMNLMETIRDLAAICLLTITARFFKACTQIPRLAMITRTIAVALADLFHFSLIFMSVFTAFAFAGVLIFGTRLEEFSTLSASCQTCLVLLFGAPQQDFYTRIATASPAIGVLWYWTFVTLVFLVLLNMLLAIVVDSYSKASNFGRVSKNILDQLINSLALTLLETFSPRGHPSVVAIVARLGEDDFEGGVDEEGLCKADFMQRSTLLSFAAGHPVYFRCRINRRFAREIVHDAAVEQDADAEALGVQSLDRRNSTRLNEQLDVQLRDLRVADVRTFFRASDAVPEFIARLGARSPSRRVDVSPSDSPRDLAANITTATAAAAAAATAAAIAAAAAGAVAPPPPPAQKLRRITDVEQRGEASEIDDDVW